MSDVVENIVRELEEKGWSVTRTGGNLVFTHGDVVITGYQEYVAADLGAFRTTATSSRYSTTTERLDFLLSQIRRFVQLAETGKLAEMARWDSAQKAIQKSSWEQALQCPEALLLIEKAVGLLQTN